MNQRIRCLILIIRTIVQHDVSRFTNHDVKVGIRLICDHPQMNIHGRTATLKVEVNKKWLLSDDCAALKRVKILYCHFLQIDDETI